MEDARGWTEDDREGEPQAARAGWYIVAEHALPRDWQARAIPVFLVSLNDEDVERLRPTTELRALLDDDDRSVASLVAEGVAPHEIAERLHLSRRSVFRRLARLRQLTGSATNAQLATKLAKQDISSSDARDARVTDLTPPSYQGTQGSDATGFAEDDEDVGGKL
jgi:DNA-binding CsgD family transcriptional regulator